MCCAALLTTACVSNPQRPDLTTGVVTADKPIATRCVKAADIPPMPTMEPLPADADVEQAAAWARKRDVQLRQYAAEQRAILIACATEEK